jgi:hypothetical protein
MRHALLVCVDEGAEVGGREVVAALDAFTEAQPKEES